MQAASFALLAFLWDETSHIDASGQSHSVAFICIGFFIAASGGLLALLILPYLVRFPARALSALLAGSSTGGMILALTAIGQGVSSDRSCAKTNSSIVLVQYFAESFTASDVTISPPKHELNFSVRGFYLCITAVLILGILTFLALEHLEICQRVKVQIPDIVVRQTNMPAYKPDPISDSGIQENNYQSIDNAVQQDISEMVSGSAKNTNILNGVQSLSASCSTNTDIDEIKDHSSVHDDKDPLNTVPDNSEIQQVHTLSNVQLGLYMSFGFVCVLIPVLMSGVLTYAAMPYGALTYSMAQKLQLLVIPIVCVLPILTPTLRVPHGFVLTLGSCIPSSYIVYLACVSPNPPLLGSTTGSLLVVSHLNIF